MSLYPYIINQKKIFKEYAQFFFSNNISEIDTSVFGYTYGLPPWAYQIVPKNSQRTENIIWMTKELQEKLGLKLHKSNILSNTIDMIMKNSSEITEKKPHTVKYKLVDFRCALLTQNLMVALGDERPFQKWRF
jgi:hypothetical protein